MRKFNLRKMSEAGSLMVEAIAMLGLISMVTPVVYKKSAERMNELEDINAASQMRTLSAAVDAFLSDNYAEFSKYDECGKGCIFKEEHMKELRNYLPKGMLNEDGTGLYGVLGEDYDVSFVYNKPENGQPTLTGYVAAKNDSSAIDAKRASRIATMIGGNGGVVDNKVVYGSQGVWETGENTIGFTDLTDNSIVVASASAVGSGGQIRTDDFLHRTEQSRQELNTMYTDLYMYDGSSAKDIMGVGRLLIGAQDKGDKKYNTDKVGSNALYVDGGDAYIAENLSAAAEKFNVTDSSLTFNPYKEDGKSARDTKGSFVVDGDGLQYRDSTDSSYFSVGTGSSSIKGLYYQGYGTEMLLDSTNGNFYVNTVTNSGINIEDQKEVKLYTEEGNIELDAQSATTGNILLNAAKDYKATVGGNMTTEVTGDMETTVEGYIQTEAYGDINLYSNGGNVDIESADGEIRLTTHGNGIYNDVYDDGFYVNAYKNNIRKTYIAADLDGYISTETRNDSNKATSFSLVNEDYTQFQRRDPSTNRASSLIEMSSPSSGTTGHNYDEDITGEETENYIKLETYNTSSSSNSGVQSSIIADRNVEIYSKTGNVSAISKTGNINAITERGEVLIGRSDGDSLYESEAKKYLSYKSDAIYMGNGRVEAHSSGNLFLTAGEKDGDYGRESLVSVNDVLAVTNSISDGNSWNNKYADSQNDKDHSVLIRRGAIDVKTADISYDRDHTGWEANAGTGYVSADRFVVDNTTEGGLSRDPSAVLGNNRGSDGFYKGKKNTYDHYMVDPAYTSVMHDIKLTSRGGARLSDILPDFINKGIYVVDNSYNEGVNSNCFNIYGNQIDSSTCNSDTSDYASAYMGAVPAPQCPPGYAKVITLQPSGWTMGQVGTLVFDNSQNGRAYIQPIDNYSDIVSDEVCTNYDSDGNCKKFKHTSAAQNYGSVVSNFNGNSDAATKNDIYDLAVKIDRLIQSSTYMKSAIKVKTETSGQAGGSSSKITTSETGNTVVGWDTYMGFIYPASYWSKADLRDLGFSGVYDDTKEDNRSFNTGVYWNLFPVDKYSIEGYVTVYCYFDRNGVLNNGHPVFDASMVDTTYNQFNSSTHRGVAAGSSKGDGDYVKRLFNPKLKYDDEW